MKTRMPVFLIAFLPFLFVLGCTKTCASSSPEKDNLRSRLTQMQYYVTQEEGTEEPFGQPYKEVMAQGDGIYVDVVSGEPLFSSLEKFDSKTGWPSFWQPLEKENIVEKEDTSLFQKRVEVRSKKGNSHLGHVFNDGPKPTGLRYCINAAALRFVPADRLAQQGYGQYLPLFQTSSNSETATENSDSITFAGGCFWGIQEVFNHVKGVTRATSGYAGGTLDNPTYEKVSDGETGHAEVVRVDFDNSKITLKQLLKVFFKVAHNPTELNKQGPDVGTQYRSAIFYQTPKQKEEVDVFIKELSAAKSFSDPIVTEVSALKKFYEAEAYHQDYARKNPDKPYIVTFDKPKVDALKKQFPQLWVD